MSDQGRMGLATEIEKAKQLIATNRALIEEIESDRAREDAEALRARARLRRAQQLIKRASVAGTF